MISTTDALVARATIVTTPITHVKAVTDLRKDGLGRLTELAVGQHLKGSVLGFTADGNTLLKFSDATIKMQLQIQAKVGDTVTLKLLEKGDTPVFQLVPREVVVEPSLSMAGKALSAFSEISEQKHLPLRLLGDTPIIQSEKTVDTAVVSQHLQDVVSLSGAFYESHLTQWLQGRRSLEAVRQEPQAAFPDIDVLTAAAKTDVQDPTQPKTVNEMLNSAKVSELINLVNTQMHMLEDAHIRWEGLAWQGQPMEWDVQKEQNKEPAQAAPVVKTWATTLRLELPRLGEVRVVLRMMPTGTSVQFSAHTDTLAMLKEKTPALVSSMSTAGIDIVQVGVLHDKSE